MNSLLGQGFVLIGLLCCAIGVPVGFHAGANRSATGLRLVRWLALAFAVSMVAANVVMEIALITHDFSVGYVAQVGSTTTPLHITIVSLWSSLEGSILFWGLILGLYTAGVAILQRSGHEDYLAYTLATMLLVGGFFSYLIAGPASPFGVVPAPIPTEGPGPNPLLQNHALMIIHPPMLYLGYVGMTAPFAMAVAALLRGQLGATWLRPLRSWLLVPTSFLTLGIMLGGWWSYEVLGWGGYWAWDPVENASFLPWLTGIAALHSAIVQQRRGTLKAWTVVLVMITFLLTILGTFLTRSGVVSSVHAFSESTIGPLFLGFLGAMLLGTVVLLSWRIDTLAGEGRPAGIASREGGFLLNNLILVAITFTVLVGTLFPIFAEAARGVKVSVGEPYFNRLSVPLFLVLILLMGAGPALPWGGGAKTTIRRSLLRPLPAALVALVITVLLGGRSIPMMIAGALTGFTLWVTMDQSLRPARQRMKSTGEAALKAFGASSRRSPRRLGGYVVHLGVLVTFLAIAISSNYQHEAEATLRPGQSLEIDDYRVEFAQTRVVEEPHLARQVADVTVFRGSNEVGQLEPSLNFYRTRREPIGTPAVQTRLSHDLYLTLMNVGNDGSIGLRAIITPAVVWIWIGVFVMAAGTGICLIPVPSPKWSRAEDTIPQAQSSAAGG